MPIPPPAAAAAADARLHALAQRTIAEALRQGAEGVKLVLSEQETRSVRVRDRALDEQSFTIRNGCDISLTRGGRSATVSCLGLSDGALSRCIAEALAISDHAEPDPFVGPAEAEQHADPVPLALDHDWPLDRDAAFAAALEMETAALETGPAIRHTEGAGVTRVRGIELVATSSNFLGWFPWSMHWLSCSPVAERDGARQVENWWASARDPRLLPSPAEVGRIAAGRAVALLGGRQIATGRYRVLLDPVAASDLLQALMASLSGDLLYRKASFMAGRIGQAVFPAHVCIREDPLVPGGVASAPFDRDGLSAVQRDLVRDGVLQGACLGLYAARRLGMTPTGHNGRRYAIGAHSALAGAAHGRDAMLAALGTGLLVTQMSGGLDMTTGDFSRAVSGHWVENGEIVHPVSAITMAGNLADLFRDLRLIGNDRLDRGGISTGSWLLGPVAVGGA